MEDLSYNIYEISHQMLSMPERISLNHLFYLTKIACSVVNVHVTALPKQPLLAQVTNQYEDHPQDNSYCALPILWEPAPQWTNTLQNTLITCFTL